MQNFSRGPSDSFFMHFSPLNAFNQLWHRVIASTVCIWWVDKAAAAQAVPLIKYSAYANEKILPSRPSRSPLYNEVDGDGSIVLIWKLVYERHHWCSAACPLLFFFLSSIDTLNYCPFLKICKPKLKKEKPLLHFHICMCLSPPTLHDDVGWRACVLRWPQ